MIRTFGDRYPCNNILYLHSGVCNQTVEHVPLLAAIDSNPALYVILHP